ncbi:nuclear transport factor 2 family protein [Leeia sp. TBRC 13508]|uniref:Nuclear transport factor 2 family protein n=1 Tax=Leeia speluncae TaxID=2884804 RepID=A0ABS8D8A4_9NEIS|nr:nuclear transport factor 2 family protein [Leeia speluncae]MCB6184445.1 nuclear transport factor 2 family protein [Leeia speluncae]
MMTPEQEVLAAAQGLVNVFGQHNKEAYFAAFAPEATFVFHNVPERLANRAAYESLWAVWEADGFRVLACESTNQLVQLYGDMAIFTHDVKTHVRFGTEEAVSQERETIVFRHQQGGAWLAVHEHLSLHAAN